MTQFKHCVFALSYAFFVANAFAAVQGAENASKPSTNDLESLSRIAQERNVDLSRLFRLVEAKAASTDEVASALLDQLNGRARKAVSEAEFDAANLLDDLTAHVDILLIRIQRIERLAKANVVTASEIDDASISLAAAKARVELARIVSLRRRQFDRAQMLLGKGTTVADVEQARARLESANGRLRSCLTEELD
jgi:multidrug resistance efflux pump